MDVILEPGDLLYMPRGTIHQGNCLEEAHSLHLTVSCHQLTSYGDLLEKILPLALKTAMREDIEFRRGLPNNYFVVRICVFLIKRNNLVPFQQV